MAWGGERGVVVVDIWRRAVVAALPAHCLYLPEPSMRADRHERHDRRSPDLDQVTCRPRKYFQSLNIRNDYIREIIKIIKIS